MNKKKEYYEIVRQINDFLDTHEKKDKVIFLEDIRNFINLELESLK